ncbi:MAG: extracellular solute-binding protein [Ignavibacteria bacterium]|nr:extracellular solute-binding protein [Ignavibacteria bacterium]MBP6509243.1 extracellular solute-binding protein [Candidatus Kapabacteria bacterium]MBK6417876.1 extracellular solute-binding protein [Ignavibacteria bacterium]MBK7185486.1 extracellular solute-binding protein [Ignavibacteria bacterium]MBK7411382.1 extracellular solute-binding protein [Ignavibacteria bacterium]
MTLVRITLIMLTAVVATSCGDAPTKTTTLQFWHFWSEPSQRSVLDSLVRIFEQEHPTIHVELTELSWADGRSKLQLAFNAGTQPDVVHLGMDWHAEFSRAGVFADTAAIPWLVNARARVVNDRATHFTIGLCATDAHNVLKRMLPYVWSAGADRFYTSLPVSSTFDSALVNALWTIRSYVDKGALLERARQLDDRLLNDELRETYTGAWIIDMARRRNITHLRVAATPSILNGDVLAISRSSSHIDAARIFTAWLTSYQQARAFAVAISDAGFPADLTTAATDSIFQRDDLQRGFLNVARMARPLPESTKTLRVEPIVEDMIVRCYGATSKDEVQQIVEKARLAVIELER